MSDMSQGPGWWQASDGKWYPPEQAAGGPPAAGGPGFGAPSGFGPPAAAAGAPSPHGKLAEWPERVIAALVDVALVIPLVVLYLIMNAISTSLGIIFYLPIVAASFYFAWLTGETGASPGKRLTGLKVVSETTGQPIGGVNGIVRSIAHVLDAIVCCIGYLLPLFDAKKQTIADKVMTTVALSGQEKHDFGPELFKK